MGFPIGAILKIGDGILKATGLLGKGKATVSGVGITAVGLASAAATGQDPFESMKVLVELAQQAWPHVLVIVGALVTVAGYFRKAGARGAQGT